MQKLIIKIFLIMTVLIFIFLHWSFVAEKFECNNVDCYEGTPQLEDDVDPMSGSYPLTRVDKGQHGE